MMSANKEEVEEKRKKKKKKKTNNFRYLFCFRLLICEIDSLTFPIEKVVVAQNVC